MTDQTRRTVRTVVQLVIGLAAALPVLLPELGVPKTVTGYGLALAVAAVITRASASPLVQRLLPAWLRTAAPADRGDAG